ncbi:hypothetical protein RB595_001014 [Gaeumannomyces hyphopodioides]
MDDFGSESDSDYTSYWRDWFIGSKGNEYYCEIDEEYLTDRFNLTGLNTEVSYYQYALDLITDVFDMDCDDEMRETIEKSARHLYGLVHARYIVTTRGLTKMVWQHPSPCFLSTYPARPGLACGYLYRQASRQADTSGLRSLLFFHPKQLDKYKKGEFGKCPRVNCGSHPLLPMGLCDIPNVKPVKLYCARCEDIYNPKSTRHAGIDGAYFGTSFHNILFQVYPTFIPTKSAERYVPRVFGFKVHGSATLIRWQSARRDGMRRRLRKMEIESGFKDGADEDGVEDDEEEEEDDDEEDGPGFDPQLREGPEGGTLQDTSIPASSHQGGDNMVLGA